MARLSWDVIPRGYNYGIDCGVLYPHGVTPVPWNGLTNLVENFDTQEITTLFVDGIKFGETVDNGSYSATLSAVTYPDEFLLCDNFYEDVTVPGMQIGSNGSRQFDLSYRTRVTDTHYQIHLVYNLTAKPTIADYQTQTDSTTLVEFEWEVYGVPEYVPGFEPTSHVYFDTRYTSASVMTYLTNLLYGTSSTNPVMPTLALLYETLIQLGNVLIFDNGDGTWTATGPPDRISVNPTTRTFTIVDANATYLNPQTYEVSSDVT